MKIAPSSAATNGPMRKSTATVAAALPTSTGATAAGSVAGRAASSQTRGPAAAGAAPVIAGPRGSG